MSEERWTGLRGNLDVPDQPDKGLNDVLVLGPLHPDHNNLTFSDDVPYEPHVVYISRDDWGALPPKGQKTFSALPAVVQFIHTGTILPETHEESMKLCRTLQWNHMFTEGYVDILYNFIVGYEGEIYEGRGWKSRPDVIYGRPDFPERIDIAYLGSYYDDPPPWKSLEAAFHLVVHGIHNKFINKSCKFIHLDPSMPIL